MGFFFFTWFCFWFDDPMVVLGYTGVWQCVHCSGDLLTQKNEEEERRREKIERLREERKRKKEVVKLMF